MVPDQNGPDLDPSQASAQGAAGAPESAPDGAAEAAGEAAATLDPAALRKRVLQLEAQLDESFARARDTSERLKETHERYLRTAAEFDNFKKRTTKEKDDARKYGTESLLKELLPVLDNLDRALDHAEQHDPKQVIEGVRLVQRLFEASLAKQGVVGFSALGQAFDPAQHEALMQQEADGPPGTVIKEMARGYKLHERLLRPAAVVVSRAKSEAQPQDAGEGEGNPS